MQENSFHFGCLLETRVKESKAQSIVSTIFPTWSFLSNYEYNRLGRIWVVWNDKVRLTPIFKSNQVITCSVLMEGREDEFFCSFIYASNAMEERKILWDDLENHYDSRLFRNKNWLVFGDFNEILLGPEHSNYAISPTISQGTKDFQELARNFCFSNLNCQGPLFT